MGSPLCQDLRIISDLLYFFIYLEHFYIITKHSLEGCVLCLEIRLFLVREIILCQLVGH